MQRKSGVWITQTMLGESYQAYIPYPLPPQPALDMTVLTPYLYDAVSALESLKAISHTIPNIQLLIYMYIRKEALLSSQIEGTQSSLSDLLLFENDQKKDVTIEDVEEVSQYVKALMYGLQRLKDGFPLSMRLLREIHAILLHSGRGYQKQPGERYTQNWIGGTRPGNALYVPPPVAELPNCLSDLEKFLHDEKTPLLIKAGLAHVQFESIHPFLDGNGRLGRLMITLLLETPVLYLSVYFKKNRKTYYDLLQEVRLHGTWETWLEFFLKGITKTAKEALQTIHAIQKIFEQDLSQIDSLGRKRFSVQTVFEYLKQIPQTTAPIAAQHLSLSTPTVRDALDLLVQLNILHMKEDKARNKVYVYSAYLTLLEKDTEPLSKAIP